MEPQLWRDVRGAATAAAAAAGEHLRAAKHKVGALSKAAVERIFALSGNAGQLQIAIKPDQL